MPDSTPEVTMEQAFSQELQSTQEQAEAPETEVETPDAADDTDKGSDEADAFTDVDPSKLPPELKAIYKKMQAGLTKKTQELAETRKSMSAREAELAQKAAWYEAWEPAMQLYATDPEIKTRVDAAFAKADRAFEQAVRDGSAAPDEFEAFLENYDPKDHDTLRGLKRTLDKSYERRIAELESKIDQRVTEAKSTAESVAQAQLERDVELEKRRFERKHPNWKTELTPKAQKLFYLELHENPDKDPSEVYEELVAELNKTAESKTIDKLVERGKKRPLKSDGSTANKIESFGDLRDVFMSSLKDHGL